MHRIYRKVLLYSTGNYTQYPMVNPNGEDALEYMYIHVCV